MTWWPFHRQRDTVIDIAPPRVVFGKLSPAEYDRTLRDAERRRVCAERKRSEAGKIATGGSVEPPIRLQGRR